MWNTRAGRNPPLPKRSSARGNYAVGSDAISAFRTTSFARATRSSRPSSNALISVSCVRFATQMAWYVNPNAALQDDPEAAAALAHQHLETAFMRAGESVEDFARSLKDAGYLRASDFRRAWTPGPDFSP
jgi:hypothetical protein